MKKLLLLLICVPFIGAGQIYLGNNQSICEGDSAQLIATYAPGTSINSTGSPILITECDPGAPDLLEIQNVSALPVDVTGWRVIISNNYTNINIANPNEQILSGTMVPGATQYWTDNSTTNYWGSNMMWNPGAYPSFTTWIMLLDNNNNVMDVFVGNWLSTDIDSSAIVTTVGTISLAGHWNGDGIDQTNIGTSLQSFSRIGNEDNDDASDFTILSTSSAITNTGLNLPFSGGGATWYDVNSGQMIGVGDTLYYSPTQSTFIAGVITDSTGQTYSDTMYVEVLNTNISTTGFSLCNGSVVLTAPSSFSTYSWSNGASTNSVLTVNTPGTYYVDCMTSNGLSCQSNPVTIYAGVIPITLSTPDSVFICQGDTVVMDGPLGFSSYSWSTGATTSSISTTSTGNYSLSVVDGNGCTGTSNTTSVSISPSTITATTTGYAICTGNLSVTLDAGSGFGSYQWYNNGAMMPNTSQTLVATVAGNYTVDVTYPTGCIATSNTITVYNATLQSPFYFFINTIGNDSLCLPNGQVTLDAGNYSTFNWSTGETSPQISVNTLGGSYSVNVTDLNGCPGVSNPPFTVYSIVNTSVISGPINPTQFQTVTYSVNPTSGSTYNWTLFGGTIESGQGTNSIDVKWTNSGMFTFSVLETDVNGCVGEEVTLLVNIIFNSVEDINFNTGTLTKITDVLGRESKEKSNVPLFYIFDDGTVEKRIIIE
ncbi:MAG: hypothetical protein HOL56_02375 [Flavobacteriales bacterium]|nr:hypothetical protein [Flavobacteriales bacterium]